MGTTLREIIFTHAGGMKEGRTLKAIIPGGASTPILTADHLDVKADFGSLQAAGSMLGSGAVIVMDDTACMVNVAAVLIRFFEHESCGKCTPCREGTGWLYKVYRRILRGEGKPEDIDLLLGICESIRGKCFCPLGEGAIQPVLSSIKYFRKDYEQCVNGRGCGREQQCMKVLH